MPVGIEPPAPPSNERLQVGEWTVERAVNQLSSGARTVKLEPKAMLVLMFLADRAGQVVSRDALLSAVWPNVVVGDDSLTQVIIKLRKAPGDASEKPAYIQTISKGGYRLVAPVARSGEIKSTLAGPLAESLPAERETGPDADPAHSGQLEAPPRSARMPWIVGAAAIAAAALAGYWQHSRDAADAHSTSAKEMADSIASAQLDTSPKVIVYPFKEVVNDPLQTLLHVESPLA